MGLDFLDPICLASLRRARLKLCPILAPPPLRGGENPYGVKRGGVCQVGWGKIANPTGNGRLIAGRDDKMLITTRIL